MPKRRIGIEREQRAGERLHRAGIDREAVLPHAFARLRRPGWPVREPVAPDARRRALAQQVLHAACLRAHHDRQAAAHRLVDDQAPFLDLARQDECVRQRIENRILLDLPEPIEVDAGLRAAGARFPQIDLRGHLVVDGQS